MDCDCSGSKCQYRRNFSSGTEKIVPITYEKRGIVNSVPFNKMKEIFFFDECNKLKKLVVDNDLTKVLCKSSIELDVNVMEQIDKNSFLCHDNSTVFIYSDTGHKILEWRLRFSDIVHDVALVNGFLIAIVSDDNNQSGDIDVYQIENQELVAKSIIDEYFDPTYNLPLHDFLELFALKDGYFGTCFLADNDNQVHLTLWKLSASCDQRCNLVHTVLIEHDDQLDIPDILVNDDCLSCVFKTFVELFKWKEDQIVFIKRVSRTVVSTFVQYVQTHAIISWYKFCALTVQCVWPDDPPEKIVEIIVTFHNFLSNKSHTIMNLEVFPCNRSYINERCFYIYKTPTFLFLGESSYKLTLDREDIDIIYHDIRKYARVIAQAYRTNTSLFCTLPLEITVDIICKTRNITHDDVNVMRSVAFRYL